MLTLLLGTLLPVALGLVPLAVVLAYRPRTQTHPAFRRPGSTFVPATLITPR
jgi:hypothetical protein